MAEGAMETERIALSQQERDRLRVLHEIRQKQITQREAASRLKISDRQIRRLLVELRKRGDRALRHGLCGRPSNRRLAVRLKTIHVWRERRASFGELVMQDSSPFRWLEERGPACQLIAVIDDATSRFYARFTEHDTTEENLRTFGEWLRRYGRPVAHYTDKNSIFRTSAAAPLGEQLRGEKARSHFGRALRELGIEWIAAHSPQAKGRIERLFATLQDRLVKEMRLAGIDSIAAANHYLETRFLPQWEQRFTVAPRRPRNAHRRLDGGQRLEEILSVRVGRTVADDHTVSWDGNHWGVPREEVCAGLRGAQVEIERRLDGSHWLRFRGRYLRLRYCPAPQQSSASPSGLRPPGLAERPRPKNKIKPKYHVPAQHPWRKPWNRTFLYCEKPDISTLR